MLLMMLEKLVRVHLGSFGLGLYERAVHRLHALEHDGVPISSLCMLLWLP